MHRYYRRRKPFIKFVYRFMTKRMCRLHPEKALEIKENSAVLTDGVLDRLPYIGGRKNAHTPIMIINGWFVLIYKAMEKEGFGQNEILAAIYDVAEGLINKVPLSMGRIIRMVFFSKLIRRVLDKQAKGSREGNYECGFMYTMEYPVWDKKGEREIKFSFERCGVRQYYILESCPGLLSFCNFADPIYGKRFRLGLDARHTMAQGNEKCTLSFNNTRETRMPENILKILGRDMNDKAHFN